MTQNISNTNTKNNLEFNDKIAVFFSKYWYLVLLVLFFSISYITYISLFTADLGRHIINGREILSGNTKLLSINYFSFTQTEYPFTNHHWLFGVITAVTEKIAGFSGLTILNMLLNTIAFSLILIFTTKKYQQPYITFLVGLFVLPLFTYRTEVRPESFSLFFFALFFAVFSYFSTKKFQTKTTLKKILLILPILVAQVLWTNIHLFFIFGPLISGYYLFETLLTKNKKQIPFWITLTLLLFVSTLGNPSFITGALAPFNIFNNYAYRVAENQSSIFMFNYGINQNYYGYVIALSFASFLFSIFITLKKQSLLNLSKLFLLTIFLILGNKINRMSSFLGLIILLTTIPFITQFLKYTSLKKMLTKIFNQFDENVRLLLFSSFGIFIILGIFLSGIFLPNITSFGTGLSPQGNKAAEFFKQNGLTGPVFNNYDIGGYLVYHLFPQEMMFIDNRPEAYSSDFIENEYLQSLKSEERWQEISQKYNINAIFFYRHDQIDGAQEFLFHRVVDENWIPIYVDHMALIFVKNTEKNSEVIEKFKLPNELFGYNNL